MKKRLLSILLLTVILFACISCTGQTDVTTTTGTDEIIETEADDTTAAVTDPVTAAETETAAETTDEITTEPAETEEAITDEEPVFYVNPEKGKVNIDKLDFSALKWDDAVNAAADLKNGVQGKFTDGARSGFVINNRNMSLTYHLLQNDTMIVNSLTNSSGVPYFENTMDAYIRFDDGSKYIASESLYSGRMNSHRLGYYYYDFRFRDQNFMDPDTKKPYTEGEACIDLLKDYGDQFTGNNIKGLKYENGVLSYSVTSTTEPFILLKGISISSEEYDAIQITLKAEYSDILSVLLLVDGGSAFSPDRQLVHRFNAGEKTTVVIPFSAMKDLYGDITCIKLALGVKSKENIEISEMKLLKRGGDYYPLLLERSYHTYPDKMHEQLRVVANAVYKEKGWFGETIVIPANTVRKMVIKDDSSEYSGISDKFNFKKLEYVGFDIKGVGVFGIIMPPDQNGTVNIELKDSKYIITREVKIDGMLGVGGSVQIYHRIYTSDSHQFNDLRKEAYIERNPLSDIQLVKNDYVSKVMPYDPVRGCYGVLTNGCGFVDAYYSTPDKQIKVDLVVTGDGAVDRTVYFNVHTTSGALECAAVLDDKNALLPIPVQVSKNFNGEFEDKIYDLSDNSFGGEAYLPLTVGKNESRKLSVLHLYQNWGKYPLKQLSSISFVQPYYHLSTGVSETNCIAPYFVFGKDGWTLPDFRSNSSALWAGQPQHTSTGRLYMQSYFKESKGDYFMTESQSAKIDSAGPVYADITMDYLSDDGAIYTTYRHTELPQTDENRTLYEIRTTVLKDVTINDFNKNFTIFKFDSRYAGALYKKISYLNENNEPVTEDTDTTRKISRLVKLGTEYPYVSVYAPNFRVPGVDATDPQAVNIAFIVKNYDITINGEKFTGNIMFRENALSAQTHVELTLDLGTVTLKEGDRIDVDLILLPWGDTNSANDDNVLKVREDTCINPCRLDIKVGEEIKDVYVPKLRAKENKAEFTLTGGRNKCVVRIYGFTSYKVPDIEYNTKDGWKKYEYAGVNGYDGYQVYFDEDGTYSFAFVFDMDKNKSYEMRLSQ